ncbi:MAG: alpha/beta hydrolase [Gammaproteobacteria bacterium]|nr:alpha/beta hydrolase [Gammaproteobacteria bacterium]
MTRLNDQAHQTSEYLLLFGLVLGLLGCTSTALFIVNGLAETGEFTAIRDVAYGPNGLNTLDIYIPRRSAKNAQSRPPTIVFFYGGCWGGCQTRTKENYLFVAQAMTYHGYVTVLADYRRYPKVKFPQIIDDARAVVESVRESIADYGGDPDRLFIMGHSAGAHLGAMLMLDEKYLKPETRKKLRGFIGLAGPYDFLPLTEPYQKALFGPEENYFDSQPVNFVEGTEPPLLLLYGNDDKSVKPRNIISLANKVRQAGGRVETHLYDDIDHVGILSALSIPLQNRKPILADIHQFIEKWD